VGLHGPHVGAWSQTFSYDAFGNLSKSGAISFQPSYSYLTNRMTQIGSSNPTYDANGNVTNDTIHTYAWDAAGRPVTIDTVGLTYDALGRMVEQNRRAAQRFASAPSTIDLGSPLMPFLPPRRLRLTLFLRL
jgi:YD repeat-containing protein